MGQHTRLGCKCIFTGLGADLVYKICNHSGEPTSMHEFILLDLQMRFPGVLPTWAVDQAAVSLDTVELCFGRLHRFLQSLLKCLQQEHQDGGRWQQFCSNLDLLARPLRVRPLTLDQVLSILPGRQIAEGVAELYLSFIARILGAEWVEVDRDDGKLSHVVSEWAGNSLLSTYPKGSPRPIVFGPLVSDLQGNFLCNGDVERFKSLACGLHEILGKPGNAHPSVWLLHGYSGRQGVPGTVDLGSEWASLRMVKMEDGIITGRVLDPMSPTPDLSRFSMYPRIAASNVFARFCEEGEARFHQDFGPPAHLRNVAISRRCPNRPIPTIYHALLNASSQVGGGKLPSDGGMCEILAAALQVHFACLIVQQWIDCGLSKLDMDAVYHDSSGKPPTEPCHDGAVGQAKAAAGEAVMVVELGPARPDSSDAAMMTESGDDSDEMELSTAAAAEGPAAGPGAAMMGAEGPDGGAASAGPPTPVVDVTGDPSDAEEEHPRPEAPGPRPRPLALNPGHGRLKVGCAPRSYNRREQERRRTILRTLYKTCPTLSREIKKIIMDLDSPGRVSFQDFILLDMAERFPGLLPVGVLPRQRVALQAGDYSRATERANSFIEALQDRHEYPAVPVPGHIPGLGPLLTDTQFRSIPPGCFVSQEVGDVMLRYVCRLLGIDFLIDVTAIATSEPWPELAAYDRRSDQRYLVLAMHVPDTLRLYTSGEGGITPAPGQRLDWYCKKLARALRGYDGGSMSICQSMRYRAVSLKKIRSFTAGGNEDHDVQGTVTEFQGDSIGTPRMPGDLRSGLMHVCHNMSARFQEAAGPVGPVQEGNNGLFHSIWAQLDIITDIAPPTAHIELWHMRAAMLRCYAYLVLLEDSIACGTSTVDMDAQFQLWLARARAAERPIAGSCTVVMQLAGSTEGEGGHDSPLTTSESAAAAPCAALARVASVELSECNQGVEKGQESEPDDMTDSCGGSCSRPAGLAVRGPSSSPPVVQDAISEMAYAGVLRLAKACPISLAVERILTVNRVSTCSRHAVYGWARQAASSASRCMPGTVEKRASVVEKVMEFITSRLTASIVLEDEDYRRQLESWIKKPFMLECSELLHIPQAALKPLNDALLAHGLVQGPSQPPPLSPFSRFRGLEDRCDVCFKAKPEQVCGCGTGRCNECFGAGTPIAAGHVFRCLWCLEKKAAEEILLVPDATFILCCECGCDMTSETWCSTAARCRRCRRLYCSECIGVCPGDVSQAQSRPVYQDSSDTLAMSRLSKAGRKKPPQDARHVAVMGPGSSTPSRRKRRTDSSGPLEDSRAVALIDCRGCVGTEAYVNSRRKRLEGMMKNIFMGDDHWA
jgi:hypothetical protein